MRKPRGHTGDWGAAGGVLQGGDAWAGPVDRNPAFAPQGSGGSLPGTSQHSDLSVSDPPPPPASEQQPTAGVVHFSPALRLWCISPSGDAGKGKTPQDILNKTGIVVNTKLSSFSPGEEGLAILDPPAPPTVPREVSPALLTHPDPVPKQTLLLPRTVF